MGEIFVRVDKRIKEIEEQVSRMVKNLRDISENYRIIERFSDELRDVLSKQKE